jgi:predicted ATPase with chaperone activity
MFESPNLTSLPAEAAGPSAAPDVAKPAPPASSPSSAPQVYDLYADLFSRQSSTAQLLAAAQASPASRVQSVTAPVQAAPASAPRSPTTLAEAGLHLGQLSDLVLKQLYLQGTVLGGDISRSTRMPFPIVDEALRVLREQKCVEVASGDLVGRVSYRFALTELGRARARDTFENCRYVGPAPVPIEQYIEQCRLQPVTGTPCTPAALRAAFKDFVIRPSLLSDLGPAVCSGKSIFVYGPPGNGKTLIAKGLGRFLNMFGGEIYVPYAIQAENSIITIYDPGIHQTTDDADLTRRGMASSSSEQSSYVVHDGPVDMRWRRIKRPVVITGGELTLDMLELQYNKVANFYTAPLHIKANGGVFLIDDFGRQLVRPKDLLNRWIVPLEERVDYLTLTTGRKLMLPFEQLCIFSTNLDPKELVDDAFLRRIKHKIKVDPPNRRLYSVIFQLVCRQRQIPYDAAIVDALFRNHYDQGRIPRSSDPRDLLEIAHSICSFHEQPLVLSDDLITECARRFFGQL